MDDLTIPIVAGVIVVIGAALFFIFGRNKRDESLSLSGPGSSSGPSKPAAGGAGVRRNWLLGRGGEVNGKNYHVGSRSITIGRGIGNFIQITDDAASRVHCTLNPVPYGLQLTDKKSSNGTKVNGEKVTVHVLKDGDEIRIGEVVFVYRAEGDFGPDHSLAGKKTGADVAKQTSMGAPSFGDMLKQTLDKHNGDVEAAAAELGVQPSMLQSLVDKKGEGDDA